MKNKINTIQDLRGMAVLYVVLFHTGMIFDYQIFSHGASGVSLFFVISGFIISYIHRNDRGVSDAIKFVKKRVVRIYLPYIIPFALMLLLFTMSGKGSGFHRDIINVVRNIFLIQSPTQSIHPYAWSLVYEVYYYFTFCLFVIILRCNVVIYCCLMAAPYLFQQLFINLEITQNSVPFVFSNLFFISGALIAVFFDKISIHINIFYVVFSLLLFLAVPFLSLGGWFFLACTVLLFFIYTKSNISIGCLKKIGDASYSIYLIHAIVLSIAKNIVSYRDIYTFLIFFICCLGLGYLYHLYIEKPIINRGYDLLKIIK